MNRDDNFLDSMDRRLRDYYQQMRSLIEEAISEAIPNVCTSSWLERISGGPRYKWGESIISKALLDPINLFYLKKDNKFLHAMLLCSVLHAFNKNPKDFKASLWAVELTKTSNLIIEDLLYQTSLRDGGTSVSRLYGKPIAGNAGEGLQAYITQIFYNNVFNLDKKTLLRCYKTVTKDVMSTGIGIGVELIWRRDGIWDISEEIYLQNIIDKKGNFNFRGPLKLGAIFADASEEDVNILASFGELIGLAYQLRSDSLSLQLYFKKSNKIQNAWNRDDWRIFPIIYTLSSASIDDKKALIEIINHNGDNGDKGRFIFKASDIIKRYKAIEYTERRAKEFLEEGISSLEQLNIAVKFKSLLESFAYYIFKNPLEV